MLDQRLRECLLLKGFYAVGELARHGPSVWSVANVPLGGAHRVLARQRERRAIRGRIAGRGTPKEPEHRCGGGREGQHDHDGRSDPGTCERARAVGVLIRLVVTRLHGSLAMDRRRYFMRLRGSLPASGARLNM
jgi:hypothetical protein